MSRISTHVLDTARGRPAAGIAVVLEMVKGSEWVEVARGVTDADGRVGDLSRGNAESAGEYRVRFATGDYLGSAAFYPEVTIHVRLDGAGRYHLPLLLSPFGYSTYRGS